MTVGSKMIKPKTPSHRLEARGQRNAMDEFQNSPAPSYPKEKQNGKRQCAASVKSKMIKSKALRIDWKQKWTKK